MDINLFDCPHCGKKKAAYRSQAYPQIVVHKCDGKNLLEVGHYAFGKVTPVNVQIPKPKTREIKTHLFIIEQVQDVTALMKHGRELENQAQQRHAAEGYLKQGEVWIVKRRSSGETEYMILIQNKTINDPRFFSGRSVSPVPKDEGEDILRSLVSYGILARNPFPREYKI